MGQRNNKPIYLPVGPILDSKDLKEKEVIGALIEAAEMVQQPRDARDYLKQYRTWLEKDYDKLDDNGKAEGASNVIVMLEDILSNVVPDYCIFSGPTDKHRSWGVWPDDGEIRGAILDGKMVQTATTISMHAWRKRGEPVPDYNLVVNDHGNMTLYRKKKTGRGHRWMEVWAVV